jgi:hypothetical protein
MEQSQGTVSDGDKTGIGSYHLKDVVISWPAPRLQTCSYLQPEPSGTTSARGCAPALRGMLTICPFALVSPGFVA